MDKFIVDDGGGGHFRTVQETINAAPGNSENRTKRRKECRISAFFSCFMAGSARFIENEILMYLR